MTKSTRKTASALAGAFALSLSLALVGCGGSAPQSTEAASEAEAEATDASAEAADAEATESQDLVLEEGEAAATGVARGAFGTADESAIAEFDALPKADDSISEFELGEIAVSEDDAEKAIGDLMMHSSGGIMVGIPNTWKMNIVDLTTTVYECTDYAAYAMTTYESKKSGATYNMEAEVKSIPSYAQKNGAKDIKVVAYQPLYTVNNKYVGGNIMYTCTVNGTQVVMVNSLIETKSYLNMVEIGVAPEDLSAHEDQLQSILDSCRFKSGESL